MTAFFNLIQKIAGNRYMIQVMAMREIKSRYVGSAIGLFWSVIHPIIMVFIYWFIFSLGFKVKPTNDIPFVVWFFCAFVPWSTFNEMLNSSTNSIVKHTTLVKRTLFPSETFPFIYVVASGVNHLIMLLILGVMLWLNDLPLSFYSLQLFYYWGAMIILMIGMGWFFSALNVFLRDIGQLVGVLLQVWFWGTPIFWSLEMLPERLRFFLKLNPMYYIVEGYRDSFLYHRPFWENTEFTIYFWIPCLLIFIVGGSVFRKLKPEFADVL